MDDFLSGRIMTDMGEANMTYGQGQAIIALLCLITSMIFTKAMMDIWRDK